MDNYQRIYDTSPLSMKLLNNQLEQLWLKVSERDAAISRAAMLETDLINANLNLQIMTERVAALEKLSRGRCDVCAHKNESMTDADSPCFERGFACLSGPYFPNCEFWEIDEAALTMKEKGE